ncbi:nicotinamide riboside transporter PnuC [Parabacteroides sp. Marseille-P3160]|uniref:nicotinamide riboside transporter PnuC n=1 Tax=Parabacteroides sp. Marseille-P3160 TaxID=1917887 RepID=UPI0009B9388F|nr:nicotinamide riboside transporter PnuC [Parabacteroides sp. Marseille-P3160]
MEGSAVEQTLEYFGVASGLLYLYLEIRQKKVMWVVGLLTSLIYVFVFFFSKFYAGMALNIYYVLISLYGFLRWSRKKASPESESAGIVYTHLDLKTGVGAGAALLLLFGGIYFLLNRYTDSPVALGDAFVTAGGIVATWMLARRILEHWVWWWVIDLASAYLYYSRGLYPTSFLYFGYFILAIIGFYNWKKKGEKADGANV